MIKRVILFAILIPGFISCEKQDKNKYPEYYRKYNEVLELEEDKQIKSALRVFKEAEKIVDFIPVEHLLKGKELSLKLGECKGAINYYRKALINGYDSEGDVNVENLCPEFNNERFLNAHLDVEYKTIIDSIFELDQSARNLKNVYNLLEIDSSNMKIMYDLISSKGFPSSKLVGDKSAGNAFIMILHFDQDKGNKKFKPIIEEAFKNGWLLPEQYAWIIDRRRNWSENKRPPYYYQLPTPEIFTMNVEKRKEINNRRDSIGLKPLSKMNIQKTESGGISIEF